MVQLGESTCACRVGMEATVGPRSSRASSGGPPPGPAFPGGFLWREPRETWEPAGGPARKDWGAGLGCACGERSASALPRTYGVWGKKTKPVMVQQPSGHRLRRRFSWELHLVCNLLWPLCTRFSVACVLYRECPGGARRGGSGGAALARGWSCREDQQPHRPHVCGGFR